MSAVSAVYELYCNS